LKTSVPRPLCYAGGKNRTLDDLVATVEDDDVVYQTDELIAINVVAIAGRHQNVLVELAYGQVVIVVELSVADGKVVDRRRPVREDLREDVNLQATSTCTLSLTTTLPALITHTIDTTFAHISAKC